MPAPDSYIYDGALQAERHRLRLLERDTNARRAAALEGALPAVVESILDVGCGTGALGLDFKSRFPRSRLIGLDVNSAILRRAKESWEHDPSLAFVNADAFHLPLRSHTFDLVACQYLLQHVPRPAEVLSEMRRVAKPGARLASFDWDDGVNFTFPPMPQQLQSLFAAKTELVRLKGGDRHIGRKLHSLATAAGWVNVQVRVIPDVWEGPADRREQLAGTELSLRQIKGQLLSHGLITEQDFEAAILLLYDFFCGDVFSVVFYFAAFADNEYIRHSPSACA